MKKVLMIGGNGFLGTHVQNFLKNEFDVYAPSSKDVNWINRKGICDLGEFDIVIHLLAIYGGLPFCMNNRSRMAIDNLIINANVYEYLRKVKPNRIITIGSGCEYPGYKSDVLHEDDLGNGKLHKSVAHYGYSKLVQLEACQALLEDFGIEYEHILLANMYGPGDVYDIERSHVVGALIRKFVDAHFENKSVQLMGTGAAVRDLIYVKDVAELIYRLCKLEKSTNLPLNASTGIGTSIKELSDVISNVLNFKQEVKWGDSSEDGALLKILSTERIEKSLNWKPSTDLKKGIKETIEWYLNDRQQSL